MKGYQEKTKKKLEHLVRGSTAHRTAMAARHRLDQLGRCGLHSCTAGFWWGSGGRESPRSHTSSQDPLRAVQPWLLDIAWINSALRAPFQLATTHLPLFVVAFSVQDRSGHRAAPPPSTATPCPNRSLIYLLRMSRRPESVIDSTLATLANIKLKKIAVLSCGAAALVRHGNVGVNLVFWLPTR